jgi:hypothetical protein
MEWQMTYDDLELKKLVQEILDECKKAGIYNPLKWLKEKKLGIFSWLEGCFPRGILPTDIDGLSEINGHFLILENKPADVLRNGTVPKGQAYAYAKLIKLGCFTIFWIGHDDVGNLSCISAWCPGGKEWEKDPCDKSYVKLMVCEWAEWADKQPRFNIKEN